MARAYGNAWSKAASRLTAMAHTRAAVFRWGFVILLTAIWIFGGLYVWRALSPLESLYRTLSAVGMYDDYFNVADDNAMLQVVRFAAIATPVIGLLFAFSGQLGRSLARLFNLGASHHVVIAGDSPPALSLAIDCRKHRDAVIMIAEGMPEDTVLALRRDGVIVLEGNAANPDTLRAARAHHAAHVVAFEPDDTANLQIEAAVRRLIGTGKRKPPIGVHVATRSAMLLKEAREMRAPARMAKKAAPPPVDPKPFSLDEMAARALLQKESQTVLDVAKQLNQGRVHLVFFGFDAGAEALAGAILKSLWSVHFEPPRLTVMTPNPEAAEAGFRARHREAFASPQLWSADIAFQLFDWDAASIGNELLDAIEQARGKPSAAIVSTGFDPGNIHLSLALKRACSNANRWPIPIFMRETTESEFTKEYARGDETPDVLDCYLQAFGAHQKNATRIRILDGTLDAGAAIAHEHYNKGLGGKDPMSMRELQAAMRDWSDVLETYRAANRAVADSAMTKIWDAGWKPAPKGKGDTTPVVPPDLLERMAKREHDRWMAERLMAGWRPSDKRDNDLMAHDKLVPWEALSEDDRARDRVQVRAAVDVARVSNPQGFVARA